VGAALDVRKEKRDHAGERVKFPMTLNLPSMGRLDQLRAKAKKMPKGKDDR